MKIEFTENEYLTLLEKHNIPTIPCDGYTLDKHVKLVTFCGECKYSRYRDLDSLECTVWDADKDADDYCSEGEKR